MSPYLARPLRSQETVLHTRRRAVEMVRARGWEWDQLTPAQQGRALSNAEQELKR